MIVLQREIPMRVNEAVCQFAKQIQDDQERTIVLDMGGGDHTISEQVIKYCDYISPNETEFKTLYQSVFQRETPVGKMTDDEMYKRFLEKYSKMRLLLKKGGEGSTMLWLNEQG